MKQLIALSLAAAYITRALLFEERVSHYGPWASKREKVLRMRKTKDGQILHYEQDVTFFDRIRQFTTRCYDIDKEEGIWGVREDRMEMWTCPKCLAFWVSGAITIPYLLITGQWKQIPLAWAAVSGGAYLAYHVSEMELNFNINSFYSTETGAADDTQSV